MPPARFDGATNGKVALVKATVALAGACPGGWVDLVGYGSTNCAEGSATAALSNTTAAKRNDHGCSDTDINSADFTIANPTTAPTPRNSTTTPAPCVPVGPPDLCINDVSVVEGNSGTKLATFTVSLSSPAGASGVGYDIATSDNTATVADNDYVTNALFGQTIAAGHSSVQFSVTVNGDTNIESSETFHVNITNVSGATVLDAQGLGTIYDDDTITPIYTIQGSGTNTPMPGATVTTTGIVVSDDEGASPTLRGFYIQDPAGDANPATSDGIFVYNGSNNNVSLGEVVTVTGTVSEYEGQTQITAISISIISSGNSVPPTDISLPFDSAADPEQYEGMLVRFNQTLYVTDTYLLGRFGEVTLSSSARLQQPTSVVLPGAPALALQAANYLNQIIVDDALNNQNPDPILFGRGGAPLSMSNTLRAGDMLINPIGVMTFTWGGNSASPNAYRLRPVNALGSGVPNFLADNARTSTPVTVGGEIRVAGMNLLNYFNTFGTTACNNGVGGTTTECRGASNASEFDRQAAKLVNAILALNADVVGLVELENDGYGSTSAIQDLVTKLNDATGSATYAFLDVDTLAGKVNALGTDAIKVGLIYMAANVTPVGTTAVLDSVAFVNGGDATARNRVSLLQAFRTNNNEVFLVNVNHLKSKGTACDAPDANDGQGNCNIVRLNAVNALKTWFAGDPTNTGDSDLLVLGDLNAYAMEDPIAAFEAGGFTNLVKQFGGTTAYSYSFDGQWGYLDHALGTASLLAQVAGITEWHINADEPTVLDYNTEYKTAGQLVSLYSTEPYRASDHDPVLVVLDLAGPAAFAKTAPANGATSVSLAPTLSWAASSGALGYEFCYDTTLNTTCDTEWISAGTNTSVPLSGLSYGSTYYWQVRAVNGGDLTLADGGTWWNFTTLSLPPGAFAKISPPNNVVGVSTSNALAWGTSSLATGYEYCLDKTDNATCDGSWVSAGSNLSASPSGLAMGTKYYWQVKALNSGGSTLADGGLWWNFTTPSSFSDVYDLHWALTWIERLYNSGITTGCNTGLYCPEAPVTRAQMAVFLIRATHGVSFVPPAPTGIFTDVPTTAWAANYIEQLYADGITTGCNPALMLYCPADSVTRAQMAAFLLRAKHGAGYAPPDATGIFSDVPTTYWAAAWIEELYAEGITTGCNTGLYCPEQSVTRAQMAAFLVRTFALP